MEKRRRDRISHQIDFLSLCDSEETVRCELLAMATQSYQIFRTEHNCVTMKERMIIPFRSDIFWKRRSKVKQSIADTCSDIEELTTIENLLCESPFFGSVWHKNCHLMSRWSANRSYRSKEPLHATAIAPNPNYTASELYYLLLRYFPNPDLGSNIRWTEDISNKLAFHVADYLKNIHGVSLKKASQDEYKVLSSFEWETIGMSVGRIGFSCYQHCKNRLMDGIKRSWSVDESTHLMLLATKAGFSAEGILIKEFDRKKSFERVWSPISSNPIFESKTPWQCFAEFQRLHSLLKERPAKGENISPGLFKTSNCRVPEYLTYEDRLIFDALSHGILDFAALSSSMRTFPRKSELIKFRLSQSFRINYGDKIPVVKTRQDGVKSRILKWMYGEDATCLAPLHFPTKTRITSMCLPGTCNDSKLAPENACFSFRTHAMPSDHFEFSLLLKCCDHDEHLESVNYIENKYHNDSHACDIFEPSCCTFNGSFLPSLPAKYGPADRAYNRICSHLKDFSSENVNCDFDESMFHNIDGRGTLQSLIALFGNVVSSK